MLVLCWREGVWVWSLLLRVYLGVQYKVYSRYVLAGLQCRAWVHAVTVLRLGSVATIKQLALELVSDPIH